ncbi:YALIA101S15e00716g1_1 [Yarrowia lipolytica]|jgi:PHS family inorganic phosphate transporter-like MFS transporter|nr:Inorganic phosphate transporter PHO84 [Yarrowia lipolytica]SEI36903.1 YALIA101S15e00716g1_1 [Yarrowia lipolytica]
MADNNVTEGGNAAFHNYVNDFAHIEDPNERRRLALEKIDNASFGWEHIRAITVAGVGFMTDAYDIFAINLGITMLGYVYWGQTINGPGKPPTSTATLLKVSTSVGTVIGQFGFGILADIVGRKRIYGSELMLMIGATISQCMAGHSEAINFVAVLTFWRIVMGIGIGGDYPLSSIITSEFATTRWRGAMMAAVFANQGWGQLMGAIVSIVCMAGFKNQLEPSHSAKDCGKVCRQALDMSWRILVGWGCVPAMAALYFRLTIPETPRYTFDVSRDIEKAQKDIEKYTNGDTSGDNSDKNDEIEALRAKAEALATQQASYAPPKASFKDFCRHFGQWKHGKILIGTAGSWFFLDIAFYGLGLNNSQILKAIHFDKGDNLYSTLMKNSIGNLILVCAGAIPGYWISVVTIDTIGRKPIQIGGFLILVALFCIIGFGYYKIHDGGLLACYILCQLFENFGPNTTTFIVPGEVFPTRYRSSAHGISAAAGKIGAIIAQVVIGTLIDHNCARDGKPAGCWLNHVMEIFALFMLCGFFVSFLIPETKRKTLEQLSEELHGEIQWRPPHEMEHSSHDFNEEEKSV